MMYRIVLGTVRSALLLVGVVIGLPACGPAASQYESLAPSEVYVPTDHGDRDIQRAFAVVSRHDAPALSRALAQGLPLESSLPGEGFTLLMAASLDGWVDGVRLLLEAGADVNARDSRGLTPLSWAAEALRADVVKVLLDKGANPRIVDNRGETPYQRAQEHARSRLSFGRVFAIRLPKWTARHEVLDTLKQAEFKG